MKDKKGREKEKKRKKKRKMELKASTDAPFGLLNPNVIYLQAITGSMLVDCMQFFSLATLSAQKIHGFILFFCQVFQYLAFII
jgi:hypothetical protein